MASAYLAKAIFEQAQKYYEVGDYGKAISNFAVLVNEYPETDFFFKASLYLGVIYYDLSEVSQAKRYLILCVKRAPKGSEEWISAVELLGTIYYEEGNDEKARELFNMLNRYSRGSKKILTKKDNYRKSAENVKGTIVGTKFGSQKSSITNSTESIMVSPIITNVVVMTNYITNYITNYFTNDVKSDLKEIKEKVLEIKEKDEELEELNRLTDIKNRLLKLSEKALMIQKILSDKSNEKEKLDYVEVE